MFCSFQKLRTSFQGNHNSQLSTLNSQLKDLRYEDKKPRK